MRLLALLLMLLSAAGVCAQPYPSSEQNDTGEMAASQQAAATPSDSIIIPDGTPLTLQLASELSSKKVKVGDAVDWIAFPLRIDGLVVVPAGTAVRGTIVRVGKKRDPMSVAFAKVVLPGGHIAALRASKTATGQAQSIAGQKMAEQRQWVKDTAETVTITTFGFGAPAAIALYLIAGKRKSHIYPAGMAITVYFNGPLELDRSTLLKLQPPKGASEVFLTAAFADIYKAKRQVLFCGSAPVGPLNAPLRLTLRPGTYSFTARLDLTGRDSDRERNKKPEQKLVDYEMGSARRIQLEIQEEREYWIENDGKRLIAKDPQAHPSEFNFIRSDARTIERDLTSLSAQDGCPMPVKSSAAEEPN